MTKDAVMSVRITSFKRALPIIKGQLEDYIKRHTVIKESVTMERGKIKYITEFKVDLLQEFQVGELQPIQLTIRKVGNNGEILLEGTEEDIKNVLPTLKGLRDDICIRKYIIDKPGMPRLFTQVKGESHLKYVEREFKCIIEVNDPSEASNTEETDVKLPPFQTQTIEPDDDLDDSEEDNDTDKEYEDEFEISEPATSDKGSPLSSSSSSCTEFVTPEGLFIKLTKGSIAAQVVDVIVNTIQTSCDLNVGVISQAVLKVAGKRLQDSINKTKAGKVNEGDLIVTDGGSLACKSVYHICVLGTPWDGGATAEPFLRGVVTKCLEMAHLYSHSSIAIPAIGTGGLGFPKDITARIMYETVSQFSADNPTTSLTEIRIVVYDRDIPTCRAFEDEMKALHSSALISYGPHDMSFDDTLGSTSTSSQTPPSFQTPEGMLVKVEKGDIAAQKVDVIVNTTTTDCDLTNGVVSNAIYRAAGKSLQVEIYQKKLPTVNEGDVIVTGGGNLRCTYVFHLCILGSSWDGGAKVKPLLRKVIQTCLSKASKSGMTSIAIPALGTGGLNYPRDVVAKIMYEEAITFSSKNPRSSLNEMRVVVYDKDQITCSAFEYEMMKFKRTLAGIPVLPTVGPVSTFTSGDTHITREGMTIKLVKGNIVKEMTDVIVNTIHTSCDLTTGVISQAILKTGGKQLQQEIKRNKLANVNEGDMVQTRGGHLKCSRIYHVCVLGTHWDGGAKCKPLLQGVIKKCLDAADKAKMTSISFPAMGTGGLKYPTNITAQIMYDEIEKFSYRKPNSTVSEIHIVVYDQNLQACQAFEDELQKLSGHSRSAARHRGIRSSPHRTLPGILTTRTPFLPTPLAQSSLTLPAASSRPPPPIPGRTHITRSGPSKGKKRSDGKTKPSIYTDLQDDKGQIMIGSICLQVRQGDITDETTDAIVNSSNEGLELDKGGAVQAAILNAGGLSILSECHHVEN
ncbi:protein mono-ADP-ribosyltransferase PARP14-like [Glandiceps talaboti]